MSKDGGSSNRLSEYCQSSAVEIKKTLAQIDKGYCSTLYHIELDLIAEFAATFSVKQWALKHGWSVNEGTILIPSGGYTTSLQTIAEAQKAGAAFIKIEINNDHNKIYFATSFESQVQLPNLSITNQYYTG